MMLEADSTSNERERSTTTTQKVGRSDSRSENDRGGSISSSSSSFTPNDCTTTPVAGGRAVADQSSTAGAAAVVTTTTASSSSGCGDDDDDRDSSGGNSSGGGGRGRGSVEENWNHHESIRRHRPSGRGGEGGATAGGANPSAMALSANRINSIVLPEVLRDGTSTEHEVGRVPSNLGLGQQWATATAGRSNSSWDDDDDDGDDGSSMRNNRDEPRSRTNRSKAQHRFLKNEEESLVVREDNVKEEVRTDVVEATPPGVPPASPTHRHVNEEGEDDSGGGLSSGGSGTERGYAASSSSNCVDDGKLKKKAKKSKSGGIGAGAGTGSSSSSSSSPSSSDETTTSWEEDYHRYNSTRRGVNDRQNKSSASSSFSGDPNRPMLLRKRVHNVLRLPSVAGRSDGSISSELADFSSTNSSNSTASSTSSDDDDDDTRSESPSSSFGMDDDCQSATSEENEVVQKSWVHGVRTKTMEGEPSQNGNRCLDYPASRDTRRETRQGTTKTTKKKSYPTISGKPPILALDSDVMAHVLTFLDPPEILDVLTMPLSKDWTSTFTRQPELWRVLCLLDPFKANVVEGSDDGYNDDDDGGDGFFFPIVTTRKGSRNGNKKNVFGKFRLLYTSFVRCMKYLARIKEDAVNGAGGQRPIPHDTERTVRASTATISAANSNTNHNTNDSMIYSNRNLHHFLSQARDVMEDDSSGRPTRTDHASSAVAAARLPSSSSSHAVVEHVARAAPVHLSDEESLAATGGSGSDCALPLTRKAKRKRHQGEQESAQDKTKKVKYGHSKLTQRLLGPARSNKVVRDVDMPWSCGIYSIINWMVAFGDVEGIQTMCLKVLPFLLEHEQQRITAQRAGLTDIVLRAMVIFPESTPVHTAAFHTIVLLARPLGGQEGMLFHTSMVNSSGIFRGSSAGVPSPTSSATITVGQQEASEGEGSRTDRRNGIAVLLDSMRRFRSDKLLQSMSCWSLVNIALAPAQKEVLVKLGGIEATAKAMMEHPYDAEVQFRALFALINLVIPSVSFTAPATSGTGPPNLGTASAATMMITNEADDDQSEREMLDEMVHQIVALVVASMKNFCSNEAILNRACLVLHNLSLTVEYHEVILWTPDCYQMLEWCLANYRTDQVLQQSAAGTLHRLQLTLSSNDQLRAKFATSIQAQQRSALGRAHAEAQLLNGHDQQPQQ